MRMSTGVATDAARQQLELARFLGGVDGFPSLPQVTRRILDIVDDPASTPRQLHDIILHDPALAARVLKVVNSAFYGVPRRVGSIERAILILGVRGVKTVAVAASLGALFAGTAICEGFTGKDLWLHSIAVAVAARDLARATRLSFPDEAFLAALVHDIGLLLALQARPDELRLVCHAVRTGGGDFCNLERQFIGFDHQELGMSLAARWRLPASCQLAAGYHHRPDAGAADRDRPLVSLVRIADTLCCQGGYGFNLTALAQPLDLDALRPTRVDPLTVDQTRDRLDGLVAEAVMLLG
jgi:HD-like signal output (HDOD) protein